MTAVTGDPELEFLNPAHIECPYRLYSLLRRESPVYKVPGLDEYVVTRYEDVAFAAKHPEIFSNAHPLARGGFRRRRVAPPEEEARRGGGARMLTTAPPCQKAKRRRAFQPFNPGRLRGYEPMIRRHV